MRQRSLHIFSLKPVLRFGYIDGPLTLAISTTCVLKKIRAGAQVRIVNAAKVKSRMKGPLRDPRTSLDKTCGLCIATWWNCCYGQTLQWAKSLSAPSRNFRVIRLDALNSPKVLCASPRNIFHANMFSLSIEAVT